MVNLRNVALSVDELENRNYLSALFDFLPAEHCLSFLALYVENDISIDCIIQWGLTRRMSQTLVVLAKTSDPNARQPLLIHDVRSHYSEFEVYDIGNNAI